MMHNQPSSSIFEFELDDLTSRRVRSAARLDNVCNGGLHNSSSRPRQIHEQDVDTQTAVQWIARLVLTAEKEVVWSLGGTAVSQRGPDSRNLLRTVSRTAVQLNAHGVSTTIICPPRTARENREWMNDLAKAGALVLSPASDEESRDLAVMDQATAIVRPTGADDWHSSRILVIQNPVVAGIFHNLLHESARYTEEPVEPLPPTAGAARQRQFHRILELMAEGCKDDVAARKAGISLRTYRRYVAEIMRKLGAESRFQAGSIAAQKGLLKTR
ncbi:helix-turn-helix transcriptional regulator [Streptomyces abyssalis]|uniref:helix-turn-helix transcriptional regulator n=1 Tax=Streptomyces abyssalis TaxID=933944 RepID=UPI00085C0E96|nr:LuxR C-terminal-related transcriptional regulator [Streptomyces abyssalis]